MEFTDLLIVGAGPCGATAAREAARAGVATVVLEKDRVVGEKRVCAAGLRPGFCDTFDLPRAIVHCDTPRLALFDLDGREHEIAFGPGHTSTREELDGTIAQLAREEGAEIRCGALFRSYHRDGRHAVVEYVDAKSGQRAVIRARNVLLAQGSTARLEETGLEFGDWNDGIMTTLQYRVYTERPASAIAYKTLELHYYLTEEDRRQIVAWMFPKRDHLAIGLGMIGKMPGKRLRKELDAFTARVAQRLYPGIAHRVKSEGHLLYGGLPRPAIADGAVMVGGTAAGLVDATNGEGIYEAAMSGRFAAQAVAAGRNDPPAAAARFARDVQQRFYRRLRHRVTVMAYLEARPRRYGILFEQLARSQRFADTLSREEHERTAGDRLFLSWQALRFAMRAARA